MFGIPLDIIFFFHISFLCVAGCGILVADKLGLSWFRGKVRTLRAKKLRLLHEVMGGALAGLIATGLLLFWPSRAYLVTQPTFYIKMVFVAALVINSFIIDRLMHDATRMPFAQLSRGRKRALMLSAGISGLCWAGAATIAFFLFP